MSQVSINEAMELLKQIDRRHDELVGLRNTNSAVRTTMYGANADKPVKVEPSYDVKQLDKLINRLAKEKRVLGLAIKATNQSTKVKGYEFDEAVFGELE